MNQISEAIATHPDLSALMVKGSDGLALLTSEERVRFSFLFVMAFRRFEAVFTGYTAQSRQCDAGVNGRV